MQPFDTFKYFKNLHTEGAGKPHRHGGGKKQLVLGGESR